MSTEFATELPRDDHAAALEILASVTHWDRPAGRDYYMAQLRLGSHPLLEGVRRAFFLKIEPGGEIHRHTDGAGKIFDTDLIVVSTNELCLNCWIDAEGVERSQHLEIGKRYRVNDRSLLHWATNDGDADRVNLMLEYPKH